MNAADEKSNTLSRCGSFYYNTLVDDSKDDAEFVAHTTWQTRALDQLQCVTDAVAGNCYTKGHFKLIHFTDKDINWRGMKAALQVRTNVPAVEPPMPPVLDYNNRYADYHLGTGTLLEADTQEVLADDNAQALLAPAATEATLPGTTELVWDLAVSPELLVTSIVRDGTLLLMGQDYIARYGKLTFFENPIHMFPDMKFMAQSYMQRQQSIYSHMLRLGQIYTFPDRVLHYYRVAQTPRTLYLAAAQACGMAVVREDCVIRDVVPFLDGYAYETSSGRYDAPYEHTPLVAGTNLKEGTVIGGDELFVLCGPDDRLPVTVNALNLDTAVPVPGLQAPDADIRISTATGAYRPAYYGTDSAVAAWYSFLTGIDEESAAVRQRGVLRRSLVPEQYTNGIDHFRNIACKGRCLVACINKERMPESMRLHLMDFLLRELPAGSVLTTASLVRVPLPDPPDVPIPGEPNTSIVWAVSFVDNVGAELSLAQDATIDWNGSITLSLISDNAIMLNQNPFGFSQTAGNISYSEAFTMLAVVQLGTQPIAKATIFSFGEDNKWFWKAVFDKTAGYFSIERAGFRDNIVDETNKHVGNITYQIPASGYGDTITVAIQNDGQGKLSLFINNRLAGYTQITSAPEYGPTKLIKQFCLGDANARGSASNIILHTAQFVTGLTVYPTGINPISV